MEEKCRKQEEAQVLRDIKHAEEDIITYGKIRAVFYTSVVYVKCRSDQFLFS